MYVRIVASGFHNRTPIDPLVGPADHWGPSGNAVVAWWNGWNNTKTITQGGYLDETATSYAQLSGNVYYIGRAGYGARSIPNYCGVGSGYPNGICDHWSGQTTVTFTRLESDLALTPEFTSVLPGATPYIDYRSNPMTVEGQPMYYNPDSSHWVPDSPANGGEATEVAVHAAGRGGLPSTVRSRVPAQDYRFWLVYHGRLG
jgi:hypothetical protein